jgi:hypothetical protein
VERNQNGLHCTPAQAGAEIPGARFASARPKQKLQFLLHDPIPKAGVYRSGIMLETAELPHLTGLERAIAFQNPTTASLYPTGKNAWPK